MAKKVWDISFTMTDHGEVVGEDKPVYLPKSDIKDAVKSFLEYEEVLITNVSVTLRGEVPKKSPKKKKVQAP